MAKVLLFSDIHIHQHRKSLDRLDHCLQALDWVFETAKKQEITDIVFGGDLFQDRQKIDVLTYHRTFQVFDKHLDGTLNAYLLLGNHDLWYHDKWDISSVKPLSALAGVTVIEKPCRLSIAGATFDFLPFTHNPISHLAELRKLPKVDRKTLVAHLAVHGAQLNVMHDTRSDVVVEHDGEMVMVDLTVFDGWDQVFLGHYHKEQRLSGHIEYIGSTLQLNFGEAFQYKHVIVYDTETGEKEYIRNTFSPQHLIVPAKDANKYPLKNNFIRLEVDVEELATTGVIELRKELQKESPACLELLPVQKREVEQEVKDAKAILYKEDQMLEQWIKSQKDLDVIKGLDQEKLLAIGKKICQVQDVE